MARVNTDSTDSTRDYASLSAYASGEAGGTEEDAECYATGANNADTTATSITGFSTPIIIAQGTDEEHGGSWNTGVYRLEASASNVLNLNHVGTIEIIGLQINSTVASGGGTVVRLTGEDLGDIDATIDKCIIRSSANGYVVGVHCEGYSGTIDIQNSVIWSESTGPDEGVRSWWTTGTVNVQNCTITGWDDAVERSNGTVDVTNCAIFNNVDDIQGTVTVTYSVGDDSDFASGTGNIQWTDGSTDWTANFTDYANGDFSLLSDSDCVDAGTTISAITDDIIGTSRPQNSVYDIGAFEYESAGGSIIPQVAHHSNIILG